MTSAQIIIVVTIVLYLAAMVFVGVYFGKKGSGSSSDDFYLGGRKMGPVVTAMSAEASDMSSYLLMGLPGLAYLCGLPEVTWTAIGLAIGTYLNWLIVARRLRRYSAKLGAITIPDFFARRFGDKKHLLSCIAAVVILIFFIPYTASGFKAIGTLFNSLFGVEYHTAMIVGGIVVVLYTVMGGFMAVSFTDLIQSIFMTIALIVIVCFGVQQAGGLDTVIDNASALPGYLNMTQDYDAAYAKVDTILMPASPRTAFKFGEISDPTQMYLSDLYTISLNICGNGGISVPLGLGEDTQLPVSAQLVGPAFKDRQLLTFARALERGFADAATGAPALSVAPDFAGKGGEL